MQRYIYIVALVLVIFSCSFFEYDDPSMPLDNRLPETYLVLMAGDTIYHVISGIEELVDSTSGETSYDTTKTYLLGEVPDTLVVLDTLTQAFIDTMTSVQVLKWWGEDQDGQVVGYYYKWNNEEDWTYTNQESGLFYVPIRTTFDVFTFEVKAVDNTARWEYDVPALSSVDDEFFSDVGDSSYQYDVADLLLSEGETPGIQTELASHITHVSGNQIYKLPPTSSENAVDLTPEHVVLPIKNSRPEMGFRFLSNPQLTEDSRSDTTFTFPTRTFIWDVFDQDGRESITDLFFAMDSLCDTCWMRLDPGLSSLTLTETQLTPGFHTFFIKARDIAGAESDVIQFPDAANTDEPDYWKVMKIKGDVLIVDDFFQDSQNGALDWLSGIISTVLDTQDFTVWELDVSLPYSQTDITGSLSSFKHVIWNGAYTGKPLYREAEASIYNYVLGGGNFFIAVPHIADTSFTWFPIDSLFSINPVYYELAGDRTLHAQIEGAPDLRTDDYQGIYVSMLGFENETDKLGYQPLYRLPDPDSGYFADEWVGNPTVAGVHDFPTIAGSGKSVLLTIPLHNSYWPLLDGNHNSVEFFDYLLNDVFGE